MKEDATDYPLAVEHDEIVCVSKTEILSRGCKMEISHWNLMFVPYTAANRPRLTFVPKVITGRATLPQAYGGATRSSQEQCRIACPAICADMTYCSANYPPTFSKANLISINLGGLTHFARINGTSPHQVY